MGNETDKSLFEIAKGQDLLMHNASGELGVKTSLYLVFTAFAFSGSVQVINFAKGLPKPLSDRAILGGGTSAAFALIAGVMFLVAALIRGYRVFPTRKMLEWVKESSVFHAANPEEEIEAPDQGILETLMETVEHNKAENEKKGTWISLGAFFLFVATAFLAVSGGYALSAYFSHPS